MVWLRQVTLTRVSSQQHFASTHWWGARWAGTSGVRCTARTTILNEAARPGARSKRVRRKPVANHRTWRHLTCHSIAGLSRTRSVGGAGVIDSVVAGIRPWTRLECARLVEEARERSSSGRRRRRPCSYRSAALRFAAGGIPERNRSAGRRAKSEPQRRLDLHPGTGISGPP